MSAASSISQTVTYAGVAATTAGALPPPASGVRTWGTLTDGPPDAEAGDKRGGGRPAGGGCSSGWLTAP